MEHIPFDLLRILATIDATDVCHYWFLRDKLVAPFFRSYLHCRSIEIGQYDEAGRKLLKWKDQGFFYEMEDEVFHLTWKGLWTLHAGRAVYGEAFWEDYY
jgi:hypothetical protein